MKNASLSDLKKELTHRSPQELLELCLRLAKFKKENKALLTYQLFEADDEDGYIRNVKREVDEQFEKINYSNYYYIKKSARKILRGIKTYVRYSKNKETEIQLLLYFCVKLKLVSPSIKQNTVLKNIHKREIDSIQKKIEALHEDLQYDYTLELDSVQL